MIEGKFLKVKNFSKIIDHSATGWENQALILRGDFRSLFVILPLDGEFVFDACVCPKMSITQKTQIT